MFGNKYNLWVNHTNVTLVGREVVCQLGFCNLLIE